MAADGQIPPTPGRQAGRDRHTGPVRHLTEACRAGDLHALRSVLDPAVAIISDGAEPDLLGSGLAGVARRMVGLLNPPAGTVVSERSVNGATGLVLTRGTEVITVISFAVRGGRIETVWVTVRPEHLHHFKQSLP